LKFGYYDSISNEEITEVLDEIKRSFNENAIIEMEDLLLNPTREAIESLIWKPDRLK